MLKSDIRLFDREVLKAEIEQGLRRLRENRVGSGGLVHAMVGQGRFASATRACSLGFREDPSYRQLGEERLQRVPPGRGCSIPLGPPKPHDLTRL